MVPPAGLTKAAALLASAALLLCVSPAGGQTPENRLEQLRETIDEAVRRERVLTSDISAAGDVIAAIEAEFNSLAGRVVELERELADHEARLAELRERYAVETRRLRIAEHTERVAQTRLERRVVDVYTAGTPDVLEVLLLVSSLDDVISSFEYLDAVAEYDSKIASDARAAGMAVAAARRETERLRREEARTTALLRTRTAEQRTSLAALGARRDELIGAQAERRELLGAVRDERASAEEDLAALERDSEQLAGTIRAAQEGSSSSSAVSPGGFVWPVDGTITSLFGMRWGRLHAGIDIGVAAGTPIRAAAAGVVVYAGWAGGYGNLVVVDHGGGIATAYAHQQEIYVSAGAVSQGQALGEVGSTGNSTGPHLHFEVRLDGEPVDPLGYL